MTRAISPVVAAPLLVAVTVVLAAVLGVMATGFGPSSWHDPRVLTVEAEPDGTIEFAHESGPAINLTRVEVRIEVEGEPLAHQPPVPFTGSTGFRGAPTGAFNPSTDPRWEAGDQASLVVAGTNSPELQLGDTVTVQFIEGDARIALAETTVEAG